MKPNTKLHLVSALNTFLTAVIVVLGAQISSGVSIEWTATFWTGILLAAVRACVKPATEYISSFAK